MSLSPQEQIIDQINKSEVVLICVSKNPSGDALGAALGFYLALKKLGKKADIVSPTAILDKYSFLPSSNVITHKLEGARDYILSVNISKEKLQQLRYEAKNDKLKIFITAQNGNLDEKSVVFESSKFRYDLIAVLGAPDLESLGNVYDGNPELFYETPVINIDRSPSNEYFGKINLIDVTRSSVSEIIFNIVSDLGEELLDEHTATNLLAGIISATESFQNKNTTPKAFLAAASLVTKSANKQEIIKRLYKTKSILTLKLMGKIMSNLKYNSRYKLGWSVMDADQDEFLKANIHSENLSLVIKELAGSSPEFDLMLLLYKKENAANGIISFTEKTSADGLVKSLEGKIENGQIVFASGQTNIKLAEKEVLEKIKAWADEIKG